MIDELKYLAEIKAKADELAESFINGNRNYVVEQVIEDQVLAMNVFYSLQKYDISDSHSFLQMVNRAVTK